MLTNWPSDCALCDLHKHRRHVVRGRGSVPAEVMLIGMGPGDSEDALGRAFVGPSGVLLRYGIADACDMIGRVPTIYYDNVVACRPTDSKQGKNRDPLPYECLMCRPRLQEIVSLVKPVRVGFLGKVSAQEGQAVCPDGMTLLHPAYLSRLGRRHPSYVGWVRDLAKLLRG